MNVFEGGRDIWCFACEDYDCACDPPVTDPEQAAAALRELHEEDETRWEYDGHVSPWDHDESFAAIWSDLLAGLADAGLPATITTGAIALVEIGTTVGTTVGTLAPLFPRIEVPES